MDAQLKAKWIDALRSGKYEQIAGVLRSENNQFCCLGVLCDVQEAKWLPEGNATLNDELQSYYLGPIALESAGLTDRQQEVLYSMNDEGKPFSEIADYIEGHL